MRAWFTKLFSKKLTFVPFLIVLFLLIVSAVTSYVVINQGTGGYKTRADANDAQCTKSGYYCGYDTKLGCPNNNIRCASGKSCDADLKQQGIQAPKGFETGRCVTTPVATCMAIGVGSLCGAGKCIDGKTAVCDSSKNLICQNGKCAKLTGSVPANPPATVSKTPTNSCATVPPNTCGYVNKAGCPDGVVYCSTGSCDAEPGAKNGIQGPAEGKTGKCVTSDPKPANTDTPTNTDTPPGGGGGGGGGTSSCAGGVLCDGTAVTGSAGQTVCGQADAGGTCRSWQCNGSSGAWNYVGDACTVEPPVAPPTTTGDATLAFTLKFQGVTGEPRGAKTVPFKVKLKGSTVTDYVAGTLTADSSGKWTGSIPFSGIALGADTGYSVYVKVGKHLQKRVCVTSPSESPVGTYSCSDNTIPLTAGENNLDFSNILQLVGDLPSDSGEQNGVVDSYDISYVLNNLGSTEENKLAIGDLNFDGVIDSQDRSLIIQSLNVKYDDE